MGVQKAVFFPPWAITMYQMIVGSKCSLSLCLKSMFYTLGLRWTSNSNGLYLRLGLCDSCWCMEVVCFALLLAMVLHPACLIPPASPPDGVCRMVAADKASLMGGFRGVVAFVVRCFCSPFGIQVFILIRAEWHSRCSLKRVASCTHYYSTYFILFCCSFRIDYWSDICIFFIPLNASDFIKTCGI